MTLANRLTFLRVILSPLFFVIYMLPLSFPSLFIQGSGWTIPVLWAIFIISEITDMLDGMAARRLNEVSDFGKLFDPFADTLTQLTCFLCFVIDNIFPPALFLVVLYREFTILFIRNLMLKKGIALGARFTGKIKTVTYILAGAAALLAVSAHRLGQDSLFPAFKTAAIVIFLVSVIFSVISFFDYVSVYRKS